MTTPLGAAVFVGVLTVLYFLWQKIRRQLEVKEPFPGQLPMPPAGNHWFFGHLNMFHDDFTNVHRQMFYDHADDHGVCSFWLTSYRCVSLTHCEDVKAMLQATVEHSIVPIMKIHLSKFLGRRNIGTLNGKEWKYHRAAILRVFHSYSSTLLPSRQAIVDVTQTLVHSLQKKQESETTTINIEPLMKMVTMDVFGRTALSCDFQCCATLEASPFARAFEFLGRDFLRRLQSPVRHALYGIPTARNQRHWHERSTIRNFLQSLVEERRRLEPTLAPRPPDLLTSLLQAHDDLKKEEAGGVEHEHVVTDETLVDMLMSLLFAGYDTTSITLMYALYLVASHPRVEDRLLQEIENVYQENDGDLSDPDRLVYCSGVITETLRMYPPGVILNRKTTKPLKVSNGFVIPQDTLVLLPIYMVQRDPRHFERPDEFHPERWVQRSCRSSATASNKGGDIWVERGMDDDARTTAEDNGSSGNGNDNDSAIHSDNDDGERHCTIAAGNRNAMFAFSGGARSCAAQKFALQEAVLVLATLMKELKFAVEPGYVAVPKRNGLVQSPVGGMPMIITARN